MSNVIDYLEELGRTGQVGQHAGALLQTMDAPLRQALVDRDPAALRILLEVSPQMYALIAPAEPEPSRPDDAPPQPDDRPAKPD